MKCTRILALCLAALLLCTGILSACAEGSVASKTYILYDERFELPLENVKSVRVKRFEHGTLTKTWTISAAPEKTTVTFPDDFDVDDKYLPLSVADKYRFELDDQKEISICFRDPAGVMEIWNDLYVCYENANQEENVYTPMNESVTDAGQFSHVRFCEKNENGQYVTVVLPKVDVYVNDSILLEKAETGVYLIPAGLTIDSIDRYHPKIKAAAHDHSLTDATCEAAKTCSACGATEGEALGHIWAEATCEAAKTCSACGATEGEALGHTWAEASCETARTCSACGATEGEAQGHTWAEASCETARTCSACGATEGEALGHTWAEASCETARICSVCEETESEALGHTWTEATCIEPKTCSVCGETEGKKLNHDYADATCTEPKTCRFCQATKGDPLKHKEKKLEEVESTCTEKGLTEGIICAREGCGEILQEQQVIAALGHKYDETETIQEATCTEEGLRKESCSRCGISQEYPTPKQDHITKDAGGKEATCKEAGYLSSMRCSVCDELLETQGIVEKLEHTWAEGVVQIRPACETGGETLYTCTVCGETKTVFEAALGHTVEVLPGAPATCTNYGITDGAWCFKCESRLKEQEPIDPLGHAWDEGVIIKEPTCEAEGEKLHKCTNPGCEETHSVTLPAVDHSPEDMPGIPATYTEAGKTAGEKCSVCGTILKEQEIIEPLPTPVPTATPIPEPPRHITPWFNEEISVLAAMTAAGFVLLLIVILRLAKVNREIRIETQRIAEDNGEATLPAEHKERRK